VDFLNKEQKDESKKRIYWCNKSILKKGGSIQAGAVVQIVRNNQLRYFWYQTNYKLTMQTLKNLSSELHLILPSGKCNFT
jgi:hypothetical protein